MYVAVGIDYPVLYQHQGNETLYIYLSKILPLFVMPVGIVIELSLLALLFQLRDKRKTSTVFLLTAVLVLWASSTPMVAKTLYRKLEQAYPPVAILDIPASECIVLLGGSVSPVMPPGFDIGMSDSIDRVRKAGQLQRLGKGKLIIVAAGNQPWDSLAQTEAQATEVLLLEWGVPASAIVLDGASRNTRENALNSAILVEEHSCGRPLLVTSAAHMPRSVAAFQKVGVDVFPVSTDVRVSREPHLTVFDWLPNAGSLGMTTDAMREWIGQRVYEFQEWN